MGTWSPQQLMQCVPTCLRSAVLHHDRGQDRVVAEAGWRQGQEGRGKRADRPTWVVGGLIKAATGWPAVRAAPLVLVNYPNHGERGCVG